MNILSITIVNQISELTRLMQAVNQALAEHSLAEDTIFAVDLAIDEMVVNLMRYGYSDAAEHSIEVSLSLLEDAVVVTISDDARPFDPTCVPTPEVDIPIEQRPIGGLGIHLARSVSKSMCYQRVGSTNLLVIHISSSPSKEAT